MGLLIDESLEEILRIAPAEGKGSFYIGLSNFQMFLKKFCMHYLLSAFDFEIPKEEPRSPFESGAKRSL